MGASAMQLGGNKVRLSNLFRRHSLLREQTQSPHHLNLISHPAQSKISHQHSAKGSAEWQLGSLLIYVS